MVASPIPAGAGQCGATTRCPGHRPLLIYILQTFTQIHGGINQLRIESYIEVQNMTIIKQLD
jgi:hypothetical protein